MLQKVRNFWIKGLLEQSLYAVARLELGLATQPDAVKDVWNMMVQRPDQTPQSLPSGTRISTVFDEFCRTLLILGAPGTGKTTLLLELTKDLLARAEQDLNHPLPVVFHLSSWAIQQLPLATWLVDELSERYQVPRQHVQTWIEKDLILPLLDGLDEVAPECRSACVEALNAYRQKHGMAVCSRLADYEALSVKLCLQGAVVLQPLTRQQIDLYLVQAGKPLAGVRAALQDDEILWELLDTPLMLAVATLAYHERSAAAVQNTGTLEEHKTQLWATYIDEMFKRRGKAAPYSRQQTVQWLAWLAAAMVRQNQGVFHLEWLQPNWLPGLRPQQIITWGPGLLISLFFSLVGGLFGILFYSLHLDLSVRLGFGLIFGLLVGLLVDGFGEASNSQVCVPDNRVQPAKTLTAWWSRLNKEIVGMVAGLLLALPFASIFFWVSGTLSTALSVGATIWGLVLAAGKRASAPDGRVQPANTSVTWRWSQFKDRLVGASVYGLFYGLVGLLYGLVLGLASGVSYGVFYGLVFGLFYGLCCGLVSGLRNAPNSRIQPAEAITWEWPQFKKGLIEGLRFILIVMLLNGLFCGLFVGLDDVLIGLLVGLFSGLFIGLFFVLNRSLIVSEITIRVRPNEGIWRSLHNALLSGLFYGLIFGLVFGLGFGLIYGPFFGLLGGLAVVVVVGPASGLGKGGRACLKHLLLRFLLWRYNYAPWYYVRFLDYTAERVFLRKVGGGYVFIHRMLLEYFVTLDVEATKKSTYS